MARFNFRHGIARRQEDGLGNPTFLQASGQYINLIVSPDPTVFLIAHYGEDYLVSELQSVSNAWGPFTVGTDYWIYWDTDFVTGELTRGYTTVPPVDQPNPPLNPAADQHWFDMTNMVMKVWTGAVWVEKLRVFAAEYTNGAVINPQPVGSQVGVNNVTTFAGAILFDDNGKPVQKFARNRRGQFITSETPLRAQFARNSNFRIEAAILQAKASENIPIHYAVGYTGENEIGLARRNIPAIPAIGIATEEMIINETRSFITKGYVQDSLNWNWSEDPGTPVFVGLSGELTTDVPTAFSIQQIGIIVDPVTIYVNVRELIEYSAGGNAVPVSVDRGTGKLHARGVGSGGVPGQCCPPSGFSKTYGFTYVETTPATQWLITHSAGIDNVTVQIFDDTNNLIIPDEITVVDVNTVQVDFGAPQTGKAQLVFLDDTP